MRSGYNPNKRSDYIDKASSAERSLIWRWRKSGKIKWDKINREMSGNVVKNNKSQRKLIHVLENAEIISLISGEEL